MKCIGCTRSAECAYPTQHTLYTHVQTKWYMVSREVNWHTRPASRWLVPSPQARVKAPGKMASAFVLDAVHNKGLCDEGYLVCTCYWLCAAVSVNADFDSEIHLSNGLHNGPESS